MGGNNVVFFPFIEIGFRFGFNAIVSTYHLRKLPDFVTTGWLFLIIALASDLLYIIFNIYSELTEVCDCAHFADVGPMETISLWCFLQKCFEHMQASCHSVVGMGGAVV